MISTELASVCNIEMGQAPAGSSYNSIGEGLPLLAGAGDFGVDFPAASKFTSSPTKVSAPNDIIMCIRATIGDLNWSDRQYCLGRGVAGLRPKPKSLDRNYLWHWLSYARADLEKKARGSTFKQVSKRDVAELEIPLPNTLDEQRRIAAILDKADAIRRKREQVLTLADDFLRSVFLEMFDDPAKDGINVQRRALSELAKIDTGKTPPTNNPENYGPDIPFVTPGDLGGSIDEVRRSISKLGAKYTKIVQPGATLVCCIGATIGKMGFLTRPAAFNQQINAVTWGSLIDPIFGYFGLTFLAKKIADTGTSTTLPILNKSQFSQIIFPVPELSKQRQFAVQVTKLWESRSRMQTQLHEANGLFQSLSQRAFAGDL
jgi:type I restriction enzyme, S subunit